MMENDYMLVVGWLSVLTFLTLVHHVKAHRGERRTAGHGEGGDGGEVSSILQDFSSRLLELGQTTERMCRELDGCRRRSVTAVCGVGVVRFNAFEHQGGDQSFAVALLDRRFSGVVLSSIYGSSESRTYAKAVTEGESKHNLSEEELTALTLASESIREGVEETRTG